MSAKLKIVQGGGPSNINLGIFASSFDVCRASKQYPLYQLWSGVLSGRAKRLGRRPFSSINLHATLTFIYGFRAWEGLAHSANF